MKYEELKPCPACGSTSISLASTKPVCYCVCSYCNMYGPEAMRQEEAKAEWNALPRRLRLEKNDCAPEEPGYYWFRHPDWNAGAPLIIECYHSPNPPEFTGERILKIDGMEYHIDNDIEDAEQFEDGEWAGPIPEPMEDAE